jgi:hypothetical protein
VGQKNKLVARSANGFHVRIAGVARSLCFAFPVPTEVIFVEQSLQDTRLERTKSG